METEYETIEWAGEEWQIEKLKPCPFCGGEAILEFRGQYNSWKGGAIIVRCQTCAASAYGCFYNGEEIEIPLEITVGGKATYAWNRRAL